MHFLNFGWSRKFEFLIFHYIWGKVFKNGPSKICGGQPLKNFSWSILKCFAQFNFVL